MSKSNVQSQLLFSCQMKMPPKSPKSETSICRVEETLHPAKHRFCKVMNFFFPNLFQFFVPLRKLCLFIFFFEGYKITILSIRRFASSHIVLLHYFVFLNPLKPFFPYSYSLVYKAKVNIIISLQKN